MEVTDLCTDYVGEIRQETFANLKESLVSNLRAKIKNHLLWDHLDFRFSFEGYDVEVEPCNLFSALCFADIIPETFPFPDRYYTDDGFFTFDPHSSGKLKFHKMVEDF